MSTDKSRARRLEWNENGVTVFISRSHSKLYEWEVTRNYTISSSVLYLRRYYQKYSWVPQKNPLSYISWPPIWIPLRSAYSECQYVTCRMYTSPWRLSVCVHCSTPAAPEPEQRLEPWTIASGKWKVIIQNFTLMRHFSDMIGSVAIVRRLVIDIFGFHSHWQIISVIVLCKYS